MQADVVNMWNMGKFHTHVVHTFRALLILAAFICLAGFAHGAGLQRDATDLLSYWVDDSGQASPDTVAQMPPDEWQPLRQQPSFSLPPDAALWLKLSVPPKDHEQPWFLMLNGAAFLDSVQWFQTGLDGRWSIQQAGDRLPVAAWSIPDHSPVFALEPSADTAWLRLTNHPAPLSPGATLLDAPALQKNRAWTHLLVGAYLGLGVLTLFLGWVMARLYRDKAFAAYVVYVGCMLGFQMSFTGVGGHFFWPHSAAWNHAAPAVFMLWLTGSGIWFVREVCSLDRLSPAVSRLAMLWALFGLVYPAPHLGMPSHGTMTGLNLYGLLSVLLSMGLCLWAWRRGERYAGWVALGFLPLHLTYPFPALRAAGWLPDSWFTQYAVLIGSAIEIPFLLYVLHRRAKHFSENRARLKALDSTDPLTGLTITPVLHLRLRDAIRRSRRYGHTCGLMLVELSNHADIRMRLGLEASDRALVVTAARISRVIRDVDTVCRVKETRFVVLLEGPQGSETLKPLAQHMVAKGLEPTSILPEDTSLRLRLVTLLLPTEQPLAEEEDERDLVNRTLARMHQALDEFTIAPGKSVRHLPAA